ncbi:DNA methylase [Prosthecochloris sp. ZM]|uniref:DNA modification methylase n=1 Tax=Prosthecochloris sp. ZM TaxID=2283143 RepID=UPI000DF7C71A|nr:DNA methyltransferase [Prosthecochloris sp. ZM]RDD29903.1 DNA methylase [Prosthecochloris sp. ZM]
MVKLSTLRINPDNPRLIKDEKFEKLCSSVKDFPKMMSLRPIVVDSDGMILGGNMRYLALDHLGYREIPDEWIKRAEELTQEERRRFIIEDNVSFGEWDFDILASDWDIEDLNEWGLDFPEKKELFEDEYEVPEEDEIETDIVPGDVFEIGPHRMVCGDSTHADIVFTLLQGEKPFLMVTDPPYGVNYDASWRLQAGIGTSGALGKVMNDDNADWREAWSLFPGAVAYVWHAGLHAATVMESLHAVKFKVRAQIIWVKNQFVISRGHYHGQHEPAFYAQRPGVDDQWRYAEEHEVLDYSVRDGESAGWDGDRKQSTVWFIDKPMKSETGHSTQKPVECMGRPIKNHTGEVYDPFLGSGTTMVAAHQLGRRCFGVELNPKYCHVIIERMRAMEDSLKVVRNGQPYNG